jgi:ATP-dependent Lon protease
MSFNQNFITPLVQDDSDELIQLINPEQEAELKPEEISDTIPILPIKNTVLFPGVVIPITVTRQKSIRLIKKANQGNKIVGVLAQRNKQAEEPGTDDLFKFGTVARIIKMLVLPSLFRARIDFRLKSLLAMSHS